MLQAAGRRSFGTLLQLAARMEASATLVSGHTSPASERDSRRCVVVAQMCHSCCCCRRRRRLWSNIASLPAFDPHAASAHPAAGMHTQQLESQRSVVCRTRSPRTATFQARCGGSGGASRIRGQAPRSGALQQQHPHPHQQQPLGGAGGQPRGRRRLRSSTGSSVELSLPAAAAGSGSSRRRRPLSCSRTAAHSGLPSQAGAAGAGRGGFEVVACWPSAQPACLATQHAAAAPTVPPFETHTWHAHCKAT